MRDGAPRIVSRPSLATAWGVSVSTVASRLQDFEAAGIILRENLGGNQGTKITFLRDPTPAELDDRFDDSGSQSAPPAPSRASARSKQTRAAPATASAPAAAPRSSPPTRGIPGPQRGAPGTVVNFHTRSALAEKMELEPDETPEPTVPPEPEPPAPAPAEPVSNLPAVPAVSRVVASVPTLTVDSSGEEAFLVAARERLAAATAESAPTPTHDSSPPPALDPATVRLPFFRSSHALRLVSAAAVAVSIAMIAFHSAGSAAASAFHWWTTLAMAIILSTGKVVLGSQAEAFFADGERRAGFFCVVGAVFLLCVDASLLYAFRGDSLSNAAAQEEVAMQTRERAKARLDGLLAEQTRLREADLAPPPLAPALPPTEEGATTRLVGEVEADIAALEHDRYCRLVQPRKRNGEWPEKVPANPARCEQKRAKLQGELVRAQAIADAKSRLQASVDRRRERLAELPGLIAKTEAELSHMQVRAASDHGAGIVARGLNWIPAGVSSLIWGEEVRPVAGRGVEIFWSWAFVLAAEMFAVGGFAVAARADRHARQRRARKAMRA